METLSSKSLMIGDLVRKLERGGHSIPVKIIAIYEHNADYETRDGHTGCMSIHGYEPIPLTEEILRKNGWGDESGGYENYLSIDKEHDVEIHCDGDTITWMINLGEYDIMRLEYVHQLQHVLRLFNIEEEVRL